MFVSFSLSFLGPFEAPDEPSFWCTSKVSGLRPYLAFGLTLYNAIFLRAIRKGIIIGNPTVGSITMVTGLCNGGAGGSFRILLVFVVVLVGLRPVLCNSMIFE